MPVGSGDNIFYMDPCIGLPDITPGISDGQSDEMKHLTASVEDLLITPKINDMIFPNTPVDFIVVAKGPTPERIILVIDRNNPSWKITYDVPDAKMTLSEELDGLVRVETERSTITFNSTSKNWEINFNLMFDWDFPKDFAKDVEISLIDIYGGYDDLVVESAFIFEPDIIIDGEPVYNVEDQGAITFDNFLRGGVNLQFSKISVHFEGAPKVSPDPGEISVGIADQKGRIWEYHPMNRAELNDVTFSIPVPMDDGPAAFVFKIFELPPGPVHDGEAEFDCILDSSPPAVADFRYWSDKDGVWMSWAVQETGSGIRTNSMEMMISQNGRIVRSWSVFQDTDLSDGRIDVVVPGLKGDDIEVNLRMKDRVGNDYSSDQAFLVSTDLLPLHDISIETIDYGPDQVIINQQVKFWAVVKNEGTEDEIDIQAVVLRNGNILKYLTIPSLPAGSRREIRWSWKAVEGVSDITLKLDSLGAIEDAYPEDNKKTVILTSEYLDVTAREDYFMVSDPQADNMEIVALHFSIRSIGSIESGPIKVTFQQDGRFMGIFQLESIYKEGSRELVVDWKVDEKACNLTLLMDPYNEILESVEDNNIISFKNPFFKEPQQSTIPVMGEPDDVEESSIDQEIGSGIPIKDQEGGTIWKGPETGEDLQGIDDPLPVTPVVIPPIPDEPTLIPPSVIPMAGVIIGTTFLGLAVFGLRSEVFRFKFLGLLIPLYSKLKKTKIEKGVRHEILGYLKAKPGAHYSELKRNLDLNDGSLVHHLRILEREEKVYSKKMGKYKLFYVSTYRRQTSIRDIISPFQLRIIEIILQNPGIVPKKLSTILDRSQTDMSYHLTELSRNGLLEKRKKGRNIHYYISKDYSDILA